MPTKKDGNLSNEVSYGPDKRTLYIGILILLAGIYIFSQFLLVVIVFIFDSGFLFDDVIQIIINDPTTIFLGIILIFIGLWLSASGAEAVTITYSYLEHKKLFSKTLHNWKDMKDDFSLLIRSSQPTMKGRKGIESWQIEIQFLDRKKDRKSRISIPSINNEKDAVKLIRNIRNIVKANPVGRREVSEKLVTGKNQKISFKIEQKSGKDISKNKKK